MVSKRFFLFFLDCANERNMTIILYLAYNVKMILKLLLVYLRYESKNICAFVMHAIIKQLMGPVASIRVFCDKVSLLPTAINVLHYVPK